MKRLTAVLALVIILVSCGKEVSIDTTGDSPTLPPSENPTDTCLLARFVQGTHAGDDSIMVFTYNADHLLTKLIDSSESANVGSPVNFTYNNNKQLVEYYYPQARERVKYVYNGSKLAFLVFLDESPQPDEPDTTAFIYNNNNQVFQTVSKEGYSEYQWDNKGNIVRIQNEGNRLFYDYKYIVLSYLNEPNALRPLAILNYPMNLNDFFNFAVPEIGWSANNIDRITFYNENDEVVMEKSFSYQKDSASRVVKIVSTSQREGSPEPSTLTYHFQYSCK